MHVLAGLEKLWCEQVHVMLEKLQCARMHVMAVREKPPFQHHH
jgi:hypothetical protein